MGKQVEHFEKVDVESIQAKFSDDQLHRVWLKVPFQNREGHRVLCIIGQNPSAANEEIADKTLRYLEEYVHTNMPQYASILMLNLYSRIDTKKVEVRDLSRMEIDAEVDQLLQEHRDFLIVTGQKKKDGAYRFSARLAQLAPVLRGKSIYKIELGTSYPPHPGNREILYRRLDLPISSIQPNDLIRS